MNVEIDKRLERKALKRFFLAACFVCFAFVHLLNAQVSKTDSLQVAKVVAQAHEQLIKRNYQSAVDAAQQSLSKATQLDFKWGLINSQLIIAQAQKSLTHYSESLNYYLQALSEIERQKDIVMIAWTDTKIGELFQEWGVPEKALPYFNSALTLQSENSTGQNSQLIERIAEVHLSLNQRDEAMKRYLQLLDIVRQKKDALQTKRVLEKIASIYSSENNINYALKYHLQILEINKQLKNNAQTAATLNVIGNDYKEMSNLDKALEYYQAALIANREVNMNGENDNAIVTNLINIGTIYQARADNRNSIKSFTEALQLKEKTGTPIEVAVMHNYLATLYQSQGNYSDAEEHTQTAITLLSGTDNKRTLAASYKRLSDIFARQGNYEKSLESYQTYSILKDSLLYREQLAQEKEKLKEFVIETTEKEAKLSLIDHEMQSLEMRNEIEREKQKIALLLKEKELQNISLQKEQSEQAQAVQLLQLQQNKTDKERQAQEILLLEQKHELQNAELQKKELQEKDRQKEIDYKNTRLALQQSQLERVGIRQQYLMYVAIMFFALVLLTLMAYLIKRRDNQKLQTQYHEINHQKEEIESINKSLVELNEEKNDLIGIVAHDLKSPLNQISGMLEVMKLSDKNQSPDQQVYTAQIEKSTNRLKRMVTKILDVNAIEFKKLNITIEKIDISALLGEIVSRFNDQATKKDITIVREIESVPTIESDAQYVSEVLENLMSNAVKYSPLEKQIKVKLRQRNDFVRIEFIDQGQGISQKDMKKLFGKYNKLSARPTAGEDSTGLGLSIVKKYVLALNGKVWCESEEGKGADFIVELPAK